MPLRLPDFTRGVPIEMVREMRGWRKEREKEGVRDGVASKLSAIF